MKYYSCIIPFYNEAARILPVLKYVSRVKKIDQIICVDDGSTDTSSTLIKKYYPKATLLDSSGNLGKTAAITKGLRSAKNNTILLLDSDLLNLQDTEINKAFRMFEKYSLDCLLLNTAPMNSLDAVLRFLFRFLLLAAGNRVVSKVWLKHLLRIAHLKGYQLEIAQNKYLMEYAKNVAYMDISARDVSKIDKIGWLRGLLHELIMWYEIVTYAGVRFFIRQSLFFARKKVPDSID